jgi:hypothetical protein
MHGQQNINFVHSLVSKMDTGFWRPGLSSSLVYGRGGTCILQKEFDKKELFLIAFSIKLCQCDVIGYDSVDSVRVRCLLYCNDRTDRQTDKCHH